MTGPSVDRPPTFPPLFRGRALTAAGVCAALLAVTPAASSASTDPGGEAEADESGEGVVDIQIINTNDFHGRLEESAEVMACTVDHFRDVNDNVIFTSSGDNIGASTFTSFIQQDEPSLEALNAMGLDVSSLGNHEFDQGAADFDDRVIPLSEFPWIGANARHTDTGEHAYDPYYIHEVDGVRVGFIGLVTEDMPRLVNPAGIDHLEWPSMADEANYYAEYLTENDLADVVTVLVHEGLPSTELGSAEGSPFGELIFGAHPNIEAVFSGHTHLPYVHDVDGMWLGQAGEYGDYLTSLEISYDTENGEVVDSQMELIDLWPDDEPFCDHHEQVGQIVDDAVAVADELGGEVVAETQGDIPFARAQNEDGTENRGASSTIGELVADAQLWATQRTNPDADFAITNSGGLRADLPMGDLSVRSLGDVQPFANTLVVLTFTGDQIHEVFEEQWRSDGQFSRHGQSSNVSFTYDSQAPDGEQITGVWIDDEAVVPDETYQVVMNSYMAGGGDGMAVAAEALESHDTGQNDLEAFVDYGREFGVFEPVLARNGIGVTWVSEEDAVYSPGDQIAIDLSSLSYSSPDIPAAETVEVSLAGMPAEEFQVDNTWHSDSDERGQAEIRVDVPTGLSWSDSFSTGFGLSATAGEPVEVPLVITEPEGGTELTLSVTVEAGAAPDETPTEDPTEDATEDPTATADPTADPSETPSATDPASPEPTGTSSPDQTSPAPTDAEATEAAAEGADVGEQADQGSDLARTGATVGSIALAALVLIGIGAFVIARSRRGANNARQDNQI